MSKFFSWCSLPFWSPFEFDLAASIRSCCSRVRVGVGGNFCGGGGGGGLFDSMGGMQHMYRTISDPGASNELNVWRRHTRPDANERAEDESCIL